MSQVSRVLRQTTEGYAFWCPGCEHVHHVWTVPKEGRPVWSFNGNVERPSFQPSVRHYWPASEGRPESTRCHYFVTDGRIQYCGDCVHKLSGQTVDMVDLPSTKDYKYGDTA